MKHLILCAVLMTTKWFTLAPAVEDIVSPDPPAPKGCQCGCGKLECKCGRTSDQAMTCKPSAHVAVRRTQCEVWTATWCAACPSAKADLTATTGEYRLGPEWEVSEAMNAHFRLMDYDKHKVLAHDRGITQLPAFVITVDGMPVAKHTGYPGRKKLVSDFLSASKNFAVSKGN
jgi:thiol-disulfide isomerase/thioredoxin